MTAHVRRLVATTATLLLLTACGTDGGGTEGGGTADDAPAGGDGAQVDIVDNDFEPAEVEVAVGETVEWENTGSSTHTVTFDDEGSGNLEPGATYSRTFDEAGEFDYVCSIHASMQGTVTVTE